MHADLFQTFTEQELSNWTATQQLNSIKLAFKKKKKKRQPQTNETSNVNDMQNTKCISGGESLRSELMHWLVWRTMRMPNRWKLVTSIWTVQQGFLHHTPSLGLQCPSSNHCLQLVTPQVLQNSGMVTLQVLQNSGMGIVHENANFRGSETNFLPPPHPPKMSGGKTAVTNKKRKDQF